jgi:hypothetical protein
VVEIDVFALDIKSALLGGMVGEAKQISKVCRVDESRVQFILNIIFFGRLHVIEVGGGQELLISRSDLILRVILLGVDHFPNVEAEDGVLWNRLKGEEPLATLRDVRYAYCHSVLSVFLATALTIAQANFRVANELLSFAGAVIQEAVVVGTFTAFVQPRTGFVGALAEQGITIAPETRACIRVALLISTADVLTATAELLVFLLLSSLCCFLTLNFLVHF